MSSIHVYAAHTHTYAHRNTSQRQIHAAQAPFTIIIIERVENGFFYVNNRIKLKLFAFQKN